MATKTVDACGLPCPQPALKMLTASHSMQPGDIMEVTADCSTFEKDVRDWCQRTRKALIWFRHEGGIMRCQIRM